MYNNKLYNLMRQYGRVDGLKACCAAFKKEYVCNSVCKRMTYIKSYGRVFYRIGHRVLDVYTFHYKYEEITNNLPLKYYMEERVEIPIEGNPSMIELYIMLIKKVGSLK